MLLEGKDLPSAIQNISFSGTKMQCIKPGITKCGKQNYPIGNKRTSTVCPEAEFLDVIGTKVLRIFLLARLILLKVPLKKSVVRHIVVR